MTMIIGMNIDEFVLIASDRREVYLVDGEVDHVISDSVNKIINWGGGFISGNGYVSILDKLKAYLSKKEISHTNEIKKAVIKISKPELPQWKKQTNWVISYCSDSEMGAVSRIGFIKASEPEKLHLLEDMKSIIWAKVPSLDKKIKELNDKLKPICEFSSLENSIKYHVSLLKDIFEYGGKHDPTVCELFDFCIQLNDGTKLT